MERQWKRYVSAKFLILLFLPGLIFFVVFKYVPMYGLLMAFKDYSLKLGVWDSPWVGFKHFELLFSGPDFLPVLRNTIVISVMKIVFSFPAPIILALMINEVKNKYFKRSIQSITYLPHFFSWVVLGGMIRLILSPNSGIINQVISFLGGDPVFFLTSKTLFVPTLVITDIWQSVGWGSIVYLAAISGINTEIYEAAVMDGVTHFQKIWYITLPSILSTVSVMLILRVGSILDAGFDQVLNLYNPAVYDVADILDTYIYRAGVGSFQYSITTAAGLFKSIIGFIMVLTTNHFSKKFSEGENGIW